MAMLIDPARLLAENTIYEYRDSKIEALANQLDRIQHLLDSIEHEKPDPITPEWEKKKEEAREEYIFISNACEDMLIANKVEKFRDAKAYLIAIGL